MWARVFCPVLVAVNSAAFLCGELHECVGGVESAAEAKLWSESYLSERQNSHTEQPYGQPASQPEAGFRGTFSRFLRTVLKIFELKRGGKQRKTAGKGPKWTLLIKFHVLRDLDQ